MFVFWCKPFQVSKGRKEIPSHFLWLRHIRSINKTQEDRHDILTHTRTQNLTVMTQCGTTVTRGCKDQADGLRGAQWLDNQILKGSSQRNKLCYPAGWQSLQITMLPCVVIKIQKREVPSLPTQETLHASGHGTDSFALIIVHYLHILNYHPAPRR